MAWRTPVREEVTGSVASVVLVHRESTHVLEGHGCRLKQWPYVGCGD